MKRLILIVVVVWLATLSVPALRTRTAPPVVAAAAWAGGWLERPLSPITERYRRAKAEAQLGKTSRLMVSQRDLGQRPPQPHELPAYLTRHDIAPGGLDPWGTPYHIAEEPDSIALISAGPDQRLGTADDLVVRFRSGGRGRATRR
jgi:hypothetical protein